MTKSTRSQLQGVALLLSAALAACTSSRPPTQQAADATAAIRAAEEVGATHDSDAAYYLQLAKENENHAKALMGSRDDDKLRQARLLLQRAQADADLAVALAREEKARVEAQQASDRLQQLNRDNQVPSPSSSSPSNTRIQ